MGFRAAAHAETDLRRLGEVSPDLVAAIARVADPDGALAALAAIGEGMKPGDLVEMLETDDEMRERLLIVLGTSEALGAFLARHPEYVSDLASDEFSRSPLSPEVMVEQLSAADSDTDLRVAYRRKVLHIAAGDLTALTSFEQSSAELAYLADATVQRALDLARREVGGSEVCRLAVIGMGKTGGLELNYISDVDVIFVYEPCDSADPDDAMKAATRLAATTMRICSEYTSEGSIWEVDVALRPEGDSGPLVRTLASHVHYYERWASTWEFQALLKARAIAGDAELGAAYIEAVTPMVWEASARENFVADVRKMRRRVIDHIPGDRVDREIKLGPGGLRDVEFSVQLLQLVHGRSDESLRSGTTLVALESLIDGGYVGRRDGAAMAEAYVFLRTLEHRIQLHRLYRTHLIPKGEDDLRRLGRSMGYSVDPVDHLTSDWIAHRREVRRLRHKLFYQPLLEAVASLPGEGLRLTPEAASARLMALGYVDPAGALAHIQALTAGVSRRSAIQRSLLPAMLSWFGESPDPDAGLLAFRKISEGLGETHWYLRKLRDEGAGAQQLASILSSSSYVTDLLLRAPESVSLLGDDTALAIRSREQLVAEMTSAVGRQRDHLDAVRAIRRIRRRELSRIGIADVLGKRHIIEVGEGLTAVATALLEGALSATIQSVEETRGAPLPTSIAIVLMGRLGGFELGYGSDADVLFVHDPLPGADEKEASDAAMAVVVELRRALALPGPDPVLAVDAELRPEGRSGALVRTLASYRAYYERWSSVWEAQALLRANPVVGDAGLCARFEELINPLRWPETGLGEDDVREVRRIKARVDAERLPRGASAHTHLKLGRGGIADVEWTVQLLQMQYAHAHPGLRTTRTLGALDAAVQAGLIDNDDARALASSWWLVSRIRNAVVLMRSKPAESMVTAPQDRAGVAHLLGYGADNSERMMDDYLRTTRHARQVVERIFWG